MAIPKEGIIEVFERFNKLINELQLHEKFYSNKELNINFLLTVSNHLKSRVNLLKDRDLNRTTYDVQYENLKSHELELIQARTIQASQGAIVNTYVP